MKRLDPMQNPKLRPYLDDVRSWHGFVRFLGLPTLQDNPDTPIDNLFISPQLAGVAVSPDVNPVKWPKGTDIFAALKESKRLIVLGDPGGGKTTLVNWLAWLLVSGSVSGIPEWLNGVIPIPLVLRELDLHEVTDFHSLIKAFLKRPVAVNLQPQRELLHSLFKEGKVMVLVDGFDEVPRSSQEKVRNALWNGFDIYNESYFIASSRLVGYSDCPLDREVTFSLSFEEILSHPGRQVKCEDIEISKHFGDTLISDDIDEVKISIKGPVIANKESQSEHKRATLVYVMPFDDQRIQNFAHNWYRLRTFREVAANDANEFVKAVLANSTTLRLARTPQLLTLMALVFRVRAQLPDGRALLYDLISEAYLESIDTSRKLAQDPYPWKEKRRWLARIAFEMQLLRTAGLLENKVNDENELLVKLDQVLTWIQDAMEHSGYPKDEVFAAEYLNWIARRSGLLLPRGEDLFAFLHLSFQEYFSALYIGELLSDPDWVIAQRDKISYPEGDARVTSKTIQEWANDARWQETLIFCFEGFAHSHKDSRRLIEWVYGKNYSEFDPSGPLSLGELPSSINNKSVLLARVIVDPHSGLPPKAKEDAFNAISDNYLCPETQNDDEHPTAFRLIETEAMHILLSNNSWGDKVWQNLENAKIVTASIDKNSDIYLSRVLNHDYLKKLRITIESIDDINMISNFINLESLQVNSSVGYDIGVFSRLKQLVSLTLIGYKGHGIDGITTFTKLNYLFIGATQVEDIKPLSKITKLDSLSLYFSKVKELEPIKKLKRLKYLEIGHSPVIDISPLVDLINLETLSITDTKVRDLRPLSNLNNLKSLDISNTSVSDLRPLSNLNNLKSLDISNTSVSDISPLSTLKKLRSINIINTQISNITSLAHLANLKIVGFKRKRKKKV
jgi:energy-coupling factor transporter ATP-binding protein EcfA2